MHGVSFEAPGGTFRFDENNNPIVHGYFVRWSFDGTKPSVKVLKTVSDIRQGAPQAK